jgi:hypothetical protein
MLQSTIRNDLRFDYEQHAWAVQVGFQIGRLEFVYNNENFDVETNRLLAQAQADIISNIKPLLQAKGINLQDEGMTYHQMSSALVRDIELISPRVFSFFMIGMACIRLTMASAKSKSGHEMLALAKSCIDSIPIQYLQDKDLFFHELIRLKLDKTVLISDFLTQLNHQSAQVDQQAAQNAQQMSQQNQIQRLIAQHKENMYELELQKAKHGLTPPLYIVNALKDVESEIKRLEDELKRIG